MNPSARLCALTALGHPTDVALLARLGPATALYVDTREYRRGPTLDVAESFNFACDHIEQTNAVYPIATVLGLYFRHLERALQMPIPRIMYILLVACETRISGIGEDAIAYLGHPHSVDEAALRSHDDDSLLIAERAAVAAKNAEHVREQQALYGKPFASSGIPALYGIADDARDDCTVAEFILNKAPTRTLYLELLASPIFQPNVSVRAFNATLARIQQDTVAAADKARYPEFSVSQHQLDGSGDRTKVMVKISDEARAIVERESRRRPVNCVDFAAQVFDRADDVVEIMAATTGGVNRRNARHLTKVY